MMTLPKGIENVLAEISNAELTKKEETLLLILRESIAKELGELETRLAEQANDYEKRIINLKENLQLADRRRLETATDHDNILKAYLVQCDILSKYVEL